MKKTLKHLRDDIQILNDLNNAPLDLILRYVNIGINSPSKNIKPDLKKLGFLPRRGTGPFRAYDGKKVFIKESANSRPRFECLDITLTEEDIKKFVKENYNIKLSADFDYFEEVINPIEDLRENLMGMIRWQPYLKGDISTSRFKNLRRCPRCGKFFFDNNQVGRPKKYCSNDCKDSPATWVAWTRASRENIKSAKEGKIRKEKEILLKKFDDRIEKYLQDIREKLRQKIRKNFEHHTLEYMKKYFKHFGCSGSV